MLFHGIYFYMAGNDIRDLSPTDIVGQPVNDISAFAAWDVRNRICDVIGYNIMAMFEVNNVTTNSTDFVPGGDTTNGYVNGLVEETDVVITVAAVSFTFGSLDPVPGEFAEVTTLPGNSSSRMK